MPLAEADAALVVRVSGDVACVQTATVDMTVKFADVLACW